MIEKKYSFLFLFILLFSLTGCGPKHIKYVHKSFVPEEIDRITILPFIDNRQNPDPDMSFEKLASFAKVIMYQHIKYYRFYRTVFSDDIGNVSSYSVQDLPSRDLNSNRPFSVDPESVDSGWIKQLGPSTEQWILVPVLENLAYNKVLFNVELSARISAYLFNKNTEELWWQCSAKASNTSNILIQAAMDENYYVIVLPQACGQCVSSLPFREGPFLLPN